MIAQPHSMACRQRMDKCMLQEAQGDHLQGVGDSKKRDRDGDDLEPTGGNAMETGNDLVLDAMEDDTEELERQAAQFLRRQDAKKMRRSQPAGGAPSSSRDVHLVQDAQSTEATRGALPMQMLGTVLLHVVVAQELAARVLDTRFFKV